MLIFEYVKLEVYKVGWPRVEWAGPTHMGHTPTLQMGILQYKMGDRSDFCPSLYPRRILEKILYRYLHTHWYFQILTVAFFGEGFKMYHTHICYLMNELCPGKLGIW